MSASGCRSVPGAAKSPTILRAWTSKPTNVKTSAYLADFEPIAEEKLKSHQHPGSEFLHVLKGTLGLKIGIEQYELQAGDSVYFDASVPHTYRRLSKTACQALIVTAE